MVKRNSVYRVKSHVNIYLKKNEIMKFNQSNWRFREEHKKIQNSSSFHVKTDTLIKTFIKNNNNLKKFCTFN